MNASLVYFNPKNKIVQRILRIKLIPKINAISFLCFLFFEAIQAKYKEKVINKKSKLQTTGKTQFGGVIDDFIERYQVVFVFLAVNRLPIPPTIKNTISKQRIKTLKLNFLFLI